MRGNELQTLLLLLLLDEEWRQVKSIIHRPISLSDKRVVNCGKTIFQRDVYGSTHVIPMFNLVPVPMWRQTNESKEKKDNTKQA